MWVTTARFAHCPRCTNCSRQFCTEDYTQCLTRNKQKIRRASEKLTKQRIILRRTETTSNLLAAAAAATCGQGIDCRNNAHSVTNILKAVQKNISVHKSFLRSKRQVLSCYNSAEAWACSRTKARKCKIPRLLQQKRKMNVLTKMRKSWDSSKRGERCPKKKDIDWKSWAKK